MAEARAIHESQNCRRSATAKDLQAVSCHNSSAREQDQHCHDDAFGSCLLPVVLIMSMDQALHMMHGQACVHSVHLALLSLAELLGPLAMSCFVR